MPVSIYVFSSRVDIKMGRRSGKLKWHWQDWFIYKERKKVKRKERDKKPEEKGIFWKYSKGEGEKIYLLLNIIYLFI